MKFDPCATNPCHPDYNKYGNFTKDIAQKLVLTYHAQGGIDYSCLQPWMVEDFVRVLEAIDKDCDALWTKAWNVMGNKKE